MLCRILIYLSTALKTQSKYKLHWEYNNCTALLSVNTNMFSQLDPHHHSAGHPHCWEGIDGLISFQAHHFSSFCSPWVFIICVDLQHQHAPPQSMMAVPGRYFHSWLRGQDRWYSQLIAPLVQLPGGKTALFVPSSAFSAAAMITLPFPKVLEHMAFALEPPQRGHWHLQVLCPEHGPWEET